MVEDSPTVTHQEKSPVPFETKQAALIVDIKNLVTAKAKIEEQEKTLKARLKDAMEEFDIKNFERDGLVLTYIAATKATSVDSKKLKENHPDILPSMVREQCLEEYKVIFANAVKNYNQMQKAANKWGKYSEEGDRISRIIIVSSIITSSLFLLNLVLK